MKLIVVFSALIAMALAEGQYRAAYYPSPTEISTDPTLRIVGGQTAARNQFPYQISLQSRVTATTFRHICGGSIISANWILTAAHCTQNAASTYRIVAGILLLNDNVAGQQARNVARVINHPLYPGGNRVAPYDISLLQLASALTLSNTVRVIAIPPAGHVSRGTGTLSGWGLLHTDGATPNALQYAHLPIVPENECSATLTRILFPRSHPFNAQVNLCSGIVRGNESACSGDSGGPFVENNRVVGVVSWGVTPCGAAGAPSVYSKTSAFVSWITQNTNGEVRPYGGTFDIYC